ncbi:DUF7560 family zinc ribbon protein [Halovivax gelatinilyticus]|nr:hypothetical protein [Halovivax gelatinilyticus]
MTTHDTYAFTCPACGASFTAAPDTKSALQERGCAHCGTIAPASAFEPVG